MSFRYNETQRLDWLKSIFPEFKKEPWHTLPVYHPEIDFLYEKFFEEESKSELIEIDPSKIIGIKYSYGYNGNPYRKPREYMINWMDLFYLLRRLDRVIDNFKSKDDLIAHIHRNIDKKRVRKYGNHYITTSGQHRLCLAKLLGLKKVKVSVTKYNLNKSFFARERRTENNYNFYFTQNFVKDMYDINDRECANNDYIILKLAGESIFMHKKMQTNFIDYYNNFKNYQVFNFLYSKSDNNKPIRIEKPYDLKRLKSLIPKHKNEFL